MELKIKNTKNIKQKAILFGYNQFSFGGYTEKDEISFLNLNMDEGIKISINGKDNHLHLHDIYKESASSPFRCESIEYTSNNTKFNMFYHYSMDANGKALFNPILYACF